MALHSGSKRQGAANGGRAAARDSVTIVGVAHYLAALFLILFFRQSAGAQTMTEHVLEDYAQGDEVIVWQVVNDNVMGGRSVGDFEKRAGRLLFTGSTNTNGGGFSSIRSRALRLDLSDFDGLLLNLNADGRRYTWRLTTDAMWRGRQVAYWADFETRAGSDSTVMVPFSDFVPRFRGQRLTGPPLNTAQITGMGLMIYDGADGPFSLELERISAYRGRALFDIDALRWRQRVLLLSAPARSDSDLNAQLEDLAQSPGALDERDLTVVVVLETGAMSGSPALSPEMRRRLQARFDLPTGRFSVRLIGKDGSVKRRSDEPLAAQALFDQIDRMPMRQREMRDQKTK